MRAMRVCSNNWISPQLIASSGGPRIHANDPTTSHHKPNLKGNLSSKAPSRLVVLFPKFESVLATNARFARMASSLSIG